MKGAEMVRIKMKRTEKGSLATDAGIVKTFSEMGVFEVDEDLAEAFVTHMSAAELTDEPLFDPLDAPVAEAAPLTTQAPTASVVDLAAMAASVADMLKGQFAADIASIGERIDFIGERIDLVEKTTADLIARVIGEGEATTELIANTAVDLNKLRADHDALRREFDEALEAEEAEAATTEKPAPKPKTTK